MSELLSLNALPERSEASIRIKAVRGNDSYRLFGNLVPPRSRAFPFHDTSLSEDEDRSFLIEEKFLPGIESFGSPVEASGHRAFDNAVKERLAAPIWQRAYRLHGDIAVSGNRGYVYLNGRLFRPSAAEKRPPHNHLIKKWTMQRRSKRSDCLELDRVLLVRHVFGHIYFHTYHDLMSKIVWADELGIDPAIPIVVDAKWARGHYGKHFVQTKLMTRRKVYFHEWDQTLRCNELYWLKPPQFHRPHLDAAADGFAAQEPQRPPGSRLVLVREKKTHDDRICEGMNAIKESLTAEGYSAIDPADYTIPEQKWIFSRAEHVVAENGSALTNTIFRSGQPLRIDSIIGATAATTTFQALSSVYGFEIHSHVVESAQVEKVTRITLDRETAKRIVASV